ncbi:solute carrier organic anion transporter family member 2A1 [Aplysia californica]|uniref:Solute carrier organic anion transporter family member n=1 Tax=Aplysia californica TaxID=6500 RepID=A0ABM1W1M4_APLCA|nr:solute carrier organic anion transporter family member 2A1 [Aplysia californica]
MEDKNLVVLDVTGFENALNASSVNLGFIADESTPDPQDFDETYGKHIVSEAETGADLNSYTGNVDFSENPQDKNSSLVADHENPENWDNPKFSDINLEDDQNETGVATGVEFPKTETVSREDTDEIQLAKQSSSVENVPSCPNGVENKAFDIGQEGISTADKPPKVTFGEDSKAFLPVNGAKDVVSDPDTKQIPEDDEDPGTDMSCGLGGCRPKALQNCRNMACFAASFSVAGIVTSALNVYVNSQITTLEKHFNFSSSVSGFLMSCNDLGYLITTLFMSYYARRLHIPRALALSTIVYGVSGLFCTIAFFGSRDQIPTPPQAENGATSQAPPRSPSQMCLAGNSSSLGAMSQNATCEELAKRVDTFEVSEGWRTAAVVIIAIGMMIQGIAKSPRQSFLGTYVDDNVPKTKSTLYLGTMVGLSIFGPALAFTLGGVFTKIYITLEETSLTPRDPRWLGAWWLGFLLFGAMGLISGIPLVFFPKRLRRQRELEAIETKQRRERGGKPRLAHDVKSFFRSLCRILCSPVYTCMMVAVGVNLMGVSGMLAFMPKYLETQFSIPAWKANILLGAVNVFAASLGTVLGGCLTSRLKLSPVSCLKFIITSMLVSTAIISLGFWLGCDQPVINMGQTEQSSGDVSPNMCTENCFCDEKNYFPTCGADGRNYFSPCHAGCSSMDGAMTFTNCSCLSENVTESQSGRAQAGLCEPECNTLYPYTIVTFLGAFATTTVIMPGFIVTVRSVTEADKPLAIGLSAFGGTLIGWFPGPVIFGAITDSTCLLWKTTCSGAFGACALYDIDVMRYRYHGMQMGLRAVTISLQTIALLYATFSKKVVFQPHTDETTTVGVDSGHVMTESHKAGQITSLNTTDKEMKA